MASGSSLTTPMNSGNQTSPVNENKQKQIKSTFLEPRISYHLVNNVEGDFYYDDDAGVGGRDGGLDDDYYYYEDDVGRGGGGGSSDGEGAVDLTENYEYIDRSTVDAGRTEYYDDEVDYYNSENSVRHNSLI